MNIAVFGRHLKSTFCSGESQSCNTLIKHLTESGHDVYTFSISERHSGSHNYLAIPLISKKVPLTNVDIVLQSFEASLRYANKIRSILLKHRPTLMIYRKEWSYLCTRLAKELNIPSILRVHDYEFYHGSVDPQWNPAFNIMQHIPNPLYSHICNYVLNNTDLISANSAHTALHYSPYTQTPVTVMYSLVDESSYNHPSHVSPLDFILHITPSWNKGIYTTLKIAEQMPDQHFVVVGRYKGRGVGMIRNRIKSLKNVTYKGFVSDIISTMQHAKIILMPSLDEGYGRIPIESGMMHIPTISSNNGGLAESNAYELQVTSNYPHSYIYKINEVLDHYKKYQDIAYSNALSKRSANVFKQFQDTVGEHLGIRI